jgi:hypothetical protein
MPFMENYNQELPIRSKIIIAQNIGQIIYHLHTGKSERANALLDEIKTRSIYLDEAIQRDVLIFSEAIQFQEAYDPWHRITLDIQCAADRLIEGLGFNPP